MKLVEVKAAKEFASTFFGDPVLKMAVNSALDNAPGFELVRCKDCKKQGNDEECPLLSMMQYTEQDDFCSYGERKDEK